jgi:hypothetical protein
MTPKASTFGSLQDFLAEIQRLHVLIDTVPNHNDRGAAYDELEKVENAMIAFRAEKRKSHDKDRMTVELNELKALAGSYRYGSIEEMLEAHGLVRKSDVTTDTDKTSRTKAKNKRTVKLAGMPQVYKYVLKAEHDDKSTEFGGDLKPGYGRKVNAVKDTPYYREAMPEEIANMEKSLADWKTQNPKP